MNAKGENWIKNLVSIVTVNYNQSLVTIELLKSLAKSDYSFMEIIVVDNGSIPGDAEKIENFSSEITLIKSPKNLGFAGGNNLGIKKAKGEFIFFVNNDTIVEKDCIGILVSRLQNQNKIGAVSPKIKYEFQPEIIQYAGSTKMHPFTLRNKHLGHLQKDNGDFDTEQETHFIHGAAMMLPASVIAQVGELHEEYFLYYEELDWSERIKKAGHQLMYIPSALIFHKESISTGKNSILKTYYLSRNRILFARRTRNSLSFLMVLSYLIFVALPKNCIKYILQPAYLNAYVKGYLWHFNKTIFSNH